MDALRLCVSHSAFLLFMSEGGRQERYSDVQEPWMGCHYCRRSVSFPCFKINPYEHSSVPTSNILHLFFSVGNVVLLTSVVTGLFMGGVGLALEETTDWFSGDLPADAQTFAFLIGLILGFSINAILLSTISSGVNAVIVMFADAPAELERNYPEISSKMREKWNEIHPGSV